MVELVDDYNVEVIRLEMREVSGVETLDRSKDVLEVKRPRSANPLFAEVGVTERVAERGQRLIEDLLAMGDEQEA